MILSLKVWHCAPTQDVGVVHRLEAHLRQTHLNHIDTSPQWHLHCLSTTGNSWWPLAAARKRERKAQKEIRNVWKDPHQDQPWNLFFVFIEWDNQQGKKNLLLFIFPYDGGDTSYKKGFWFGQRLLWTIFPIYFNNIRMILQSEAYTDQAKK